MGNCGQGTNHLSGPKIASLTAAQEHSFSKQKEMWKTIQTKVNSGCTVQLILNMKVQWLSMYLMLDQAKRKKDVHSIFQTKHLYLLFVCFSVD